MSFPPGDPWSAPTPAPVPSPPAASGPVIVEIAEIEVTSTLIRTPVGDFPLAGSRWQVTDHWFPQRRTPTWAKVLAFVGICVTVGVDAVHFIAPARGGDVLIFNAAVNRAWKSSMEVGCKVEAELIGGGDRRHVLSAYLTFVAMDANGHPRPVPPVVPETREEKLRYEEAQLRREARLRHAKDVKRLRAAHT